MSEREMKTGSGRAYTPAEADAWRAKNAADAKAKAANGPAKMDIPGLLDFINGQGKVKLPISYKKKDLLIYAVGIGCEEDRFCYELNPDFEMFPTFPCSLFRKGDSDDVHFQKYQPVVMAAGLPYRRLGAPPMRMVFDAERYIERVKEMPIDGGQFFMRFETGSVMWKKEGKSLINEYTTNIEDDAGNIYYKCWSSAFANMTAPVAKFDDIGRTAGATVTPPDRAPDAVEVYEMDRSLPLLYRHTGDFGPGEKTLGDPPGFNGLGSLGIATRMVLRRYAGNAGKAFHAIRVRFTTPVFGGNILETSMWLPKDAAEVAASGGAAPAGTKRVVFRTICQQTGKTVMANAFVDLKEEFFKDGPGKAKL